MAACLAFVFLGEWQPFLLNNVLWFTFQESQLSKSWWGALCDNGPVLNR